MESSKRTGKVLLAAILLGLSGTAIAGGFVELEGVFDDDSRDLTNPWLPLPEGSQLIHIAETEDECVVSVLDVLPPVGLMTTEIKGVKVRTLWDREFIEERIGRINHVCGHLGNYVCLIRGERNKP
jgi:hypothetical protein